MNKKNSVAFITILFAATYMVSYITRHNYAAIISAIESATNYSRDALSIAVTGTFITYGVGQVVSGIIGDKFSPKKLVSFGLALTTTMNLLIPLCNSPSTMCIVWCVNGFAQSMIWPPLVKLMSALMSNDDYKKATARVSYGGNFGTMLVYLGSSILLLWFSWKSVFIVSAITGVVMLVLWNVTMKGVEVAPIQKNTLPESEKLINNTSANGDVEPAKKVKIFTPTFVFIMLSIILMGMLRDGTTTWMPSYISETYNLKSSSAILTSCILPIVNILALMLSSKIYIRKFTNPLKCSALFFGVGVLSLIILYVFDGKSIVLSLLFMALLIGSMHGGGLILVCMIPGFYKSSGKVSMVSGVLNSCAYIGSAISTYGIAVISQRGSWNMVILIWIITAVLGLLICLVLMSPWNKHYAKNDVENS